MSASVNTAPAQAAGWGRFPTALAALALVVVLAVAVAVVALNGAKAAPAAPVAPAAGAPPIGYDHGSSIDWGRSVTNVPFYDHSFSNGDIDWGRSVTSVPFNDHGWSSAETYELPQYYGPFYHTQEQIYLGSEPEKTGPRLRPQ
jgi:hypothetical protein